MALMTKELEKRFQEVGLIWEFETATVVATFHCKATDETWRAMEYYPEEQMFYGYMSPWGEWGYFSLQSLKSYAAHGTPVERDMQCGEYSIADVPRVLLPERHT